MSVTTPPRPGATPPGPPPAPRGQGAAATATGPRPAVSRAAFTARRRTSGASLGALPVTNLVVLEVGVAIGLVLLAVDLEKLKYVAIGVAAVALLVAFIRWHGRWFTQWIGLTTRYTLRSHTRVSRDSDPVSVDTLAEAEGSTVTGPDDQRV